MRQAGIGCAEERSASWAAWLDAPPASAHPTPVRFQNWTHGIRLESAFYLAG